MIKKIDNVIGRISGTIGFFTFIAYVLIMALITVDVIFRKAFHSSILGSYELVERMLLILVFAAFAYTQTNRGHIHVTLFISRMPKAFSMILFGFLGLLSAGTAVFCAYATLLQGNFSVSSSTVTAVLHIPLYPFFYIAAFCMLIFAVTLLWDAIKSFIGVGNKEVAADIRSSWD